MTKFLTTTAKFLLLILLSGNLIACTALLPDPHQVEIQQGNLLETEALAQLQTGMNKQQVEFLLGSPIVRDAFHRDRWDYVFYQVTDRELEPEVKQLTLYFQGDELIRIENQYSHSEASD